MPFKAKKIYLTDRQYEQLNQVVASRTERNDHILRANIILSCSKGQSNSKIAQSLNIHRETVRKWRQRWLEHQSVLINLEEKTFGLLINVRY